MTRPAGEGLSDEERYDQGMAVRRAVLSDAHVDRAIANTTPTTADFQDFITRVAWGDVWSRPGLERRMRSVAVLSSLIALGHHEEFVMHVHAALRNGLSAAEIREVILQSAVYAGVPAANTAFRLAAPILDEA
ncbi:4-carboxymuconolactone decarboxylase [Microbacterium sp. SORGH_AS_0888]|uniref:4-carboxymuconolactone decarboxylase n=1 Tax=Microbacterium sp. SORGH_AS_0888 TaxID=3041791 RepID=UPI00277FA0A1|nr:4-carboxymuconolactone decarboxylase [Microbacterium sp. SORGH_AS_0888]MDQ1129613.1 4-carboxymuconolactone decarboxylase [Microbacterium sp. SORGH_AS_0888]